MIAKIEFMITVHYSLGQNAPSCDCLIESSPTKFSHTCSEYSLIIQKSIPGTKDILLSLVYIPKVFLDFLIFGVEPANFADKKPTVLQQFSSKFSVNL